MADSTVLEILRGLDFFHGIADEHLKRLAELAKPVEFPAQAKIFSEHETAKDVYVIISGEVSLVICAPKVGCRQLMKVGGGELIGWSPLVGRPRLSDTAQTLTPVKALAVDGAQVLALCSEDPQFGFEFMHRAAIALSDRLNATRMQLLKLSGFELPDVQIESD